MTPMDDQASGLRAKMAGRRCRVITITSGKGGVGKTSLVANLGLELSRLGREVLLLDGDIGLANLSILFNLAPRWALDDVLAGRATLADAVVEARPGLRLINAAGAAGVAGLSDDGRRDLITQIGAIGSGLDFILIDTGAGVSSTVLSLVAIADRALLVTNHEPTALSDAYTLLKAALGLGQGRIDLVVNLAASHTQARETHARLCRLTERFLAWAPSLTAVIPRDDCVGEAIVRQRPLTTIYPNAQATRAVAALARTLNADEWSPDARRHVPVAIPVRE
jgi:flagellar biosynthesis protein FlhG